MTLSCSPTLTAEAKTASVEMKLLTHKLESALKKNDLSEVKTILARFKNEFGKDINDLEVSLRESGISRPILFEYLHWHSHDLKQSKNITKYLLVDKKASLITTNQHALKLAFAYAVCVPDFTEFLVKECSADVNTSAPVNSSTPKKKEFDQHIVLTPLGTTLCCLMQLDTAMPNYSTAHAALTANLNKLLALGANVKLALPFILQRYLAHDRDYSETQKPLLKEMINRIKIPIDSLITLKCTKENSDYLKAILFSLGLESTQLEKIEAINSFSVEGFKLLHSLVINIIPIIFKKEPSTKSICELITPVIDEQLNNITANTVKAEEKTTSKQIPLLERKDQHAVLKAKLTIELTKKDTLSAQLALDKANQKSIMDQLTRANKNVIVTCKKHETAHDTEFKKLLQKQQKEIAKLQPTLQKNIKEITDAKQQLAEESKQKHILDQQLTQLRDQINQHAEDLKVRQSQLDVEKKTTSSFHKKCKRSLKKLEKAQAKYETLTGQRLPVDEKKVAATEPATLAVEHQQIKSQQILFAELNQRRATVAKELEKSQAFLAETKEQTLPDPYKLMQQQMKKAELIRSLELKKAELAALNERNRQLANECQQNDAKLQQAKKMLHDTAVQLKANLATFFTAPATQTIFAPGGSRIVAPKT